MKNDTLIDRLILAVAADYLRRDTRVSATIILGELRGHRARSDITYAGGLLRAYGVPSVTEVARSLDTFAEQFGFLEKTGDEYQFTPLGRYVTSIDGPYRIPFRRIVPEPDITFKKLLPLSVDPGPVV
ncbi:hypothetical protein D6789_02220 [Candidatus Woesearchaeota archaeon]|nr:MAG: hypothetical protein D6789_02220 [Candidatus Woesearchaeota archaeon]